MPASGGASIECEHADFLNQMLYLDTKIFMPTLNLTYNDKMSMASSVEVRVPFLDRELAEFVAWNVPPDLKLKGKWRPVTKHIFREAMRGMLPEEVMRQPKAGFAAPVDYWLANDLRPMVDDLLSETQVRRRGLVSSGSRAQYIEEHRQRRGRLVDADLATADAGNMDAAVSSMAARKSWRERQIDLPQRFSDRWRLHEATSTGRAHGRIEGRGSSGAATVARLCAGASRCVVGFGRHGARIGRIRRQESTGEGEGASRSGA